MTKSIVPQRVGEVADQIQSEAISLKVGARMMFNELAISFSDTDAVESAIGNLYFLTQAVDDLAARLEELSIAAYAIAQTQKSTA